ncbi:MAG: hypothetical protein IPL99_00015 [Candidatus Competibacteraceae bacterium]|nr:hypothetical protein [Candidatus Competibacteraceae bacterium]
MPLEDVIITLFCWIEEHLNPLIGDNRLRLRGFTPKLTDGEVLTVEVVGEFLGLDTDQPIGQYFRQHWPLWFPQRGSRPTFAQQAAHLWAIKQQLHQPLVLDLGAVADPIPSRGWLSSAALRPDPRLPLPGVCRRSRLWLLRRKKAVLFQYIALLYRVVEFLNIFFKNVIVFNDNFYRRME